MSVMSIAPWRFELRAGEGGDRDRHVEQRFLAAARGDDDVAVDSPRRRRLRPSTASGVLREGGRGEQRSAAVREREAVRIVCACERDHVIPSHDGTRLTRVVRDRNAYTET